MNLLDFTHREGETANAMIDRFETIIMICLDQGVAATKSLQKRMLLARPAERYAFLKQSYLLPPVPTRRNEMTTGVRTSRKSMVINHDVLEGKKNRPNQSQWPITHSLRPLTLAVISGYRREVSEAFDASILQRMSYLAE